MIEYSESIVTFLDLLGFKRIVCDEPDPNRVNAILERLTTATHFDADIAEDIDLKTICVSDCVIRSVRVSRDLQIPVLQCELSELIHIQANLLSCGYVVRGGVTIGKIFMDGNRVFGPAYQRAVQLEKEACNPRIIIDDALVEEFRKCPEALGGADSTCAREELARLMRPDRDGKWFVDYLRCFEAECDDADEYAQFLRAHKRLVCDGLAANLDDKHTQAKYVWLGRYHDSVVAEFAEQSLGSCGVRNCEP